MFNQLDFGNIFNFTKEEEDEIDRALKEYINEPEKRKDYCYNYQSDDLYCHAMTFKCKKCDKIILGGEDG